MQIITWKVIVDFRCYSYIWCRTHEY